MPHQPSLGRQCAAEVVGTFFLVFFGTGSIFVGALTGALQGLFQVAVVWGLAIALAIYSVGALSGAHLNPAVTIAVAFLRDFPKRHILPFIGAQLAGAAWSTIWSSAPPPQRRRPQPVEPLDCERLVTETASAHAR